MVLSPLSALQALFPGPQKLIQKRYDKLLDYNGYHQKTVGEEIDLARKEYEALNAQLVEELRLFNEAAKKIVTDCLCSFIVLLRDLMSSTLQSFSIEEDPGHVFSCQDLAETQQQVMEEVHSLNFVKESNSTTFLERKLSFEKKKPAPPQNACTRQTESHRSIILSMYNLDLLYQAKRKCNATQEYDIDLYEGDLVAVVEQKDPFGSASRWLVDAGSKNCLGVGKFGGGKMHKATKEEQVSSPEEPEDRCHPSVSKGYVYSSFLKPYNPAKVQKDVEEASFCDGDFDNISLFVSSRQMENGCTKRGHKRSDSGSSCNSLYEKPAVNGTETDNIYEVDDQHTFYAVHAFQARSHQELSLQEYQRVRILQFSDLSGNKEWWLAEAKGQRGYVPANYLGKMTYA